MLNEEAVLFANDAFYLALSQGDYPAMEAIWANEAQVCCLHPGWEPLFGRTSVLESWRGILENPPSVECLDPRAIILDHAAIVICYERIDTTYLAATNQFVLERDQICMVHHHAAPTRGKPKTGSRSKRIIN